MSKFKFSVILVLLVCFKCCWTQIDEDLVSTTPGIENDVICTQCDCTDNLVNCSDQNITALFQDGDWDTLQDVIPLTVDLSFNKISKIYRFPILPIQVLNLSNCEIFSLEDGSFVNLHNLTALDLTRNKISTSAISKRTFFAIPNPTKRTLEFKMMRHLSLAYNDLHTLPQDIFIFMSGLTYLDLSGNPLAYIDQVTMGAISELKNMRELRLSGCELENLPEGFLRRHRKIQRLDLSDNRFSIIPSALAEAPSLVYLNFDKNALKIIEANNAITNLTKLQELSMSRNSRLQNITAGGLGGLSSLVVLRLNNNPRLTYLDPGFLVWKNDDGEEMWPMVKELYLNNNNLSGIDPRVLDCWNDLETGDFSGNSYSCDCNQWMVDVLVPVLKNTPANGTVNNMVCKKPADMRGLTFSQLFDTSRLLVCPESENISELSAPNMAILLGIMIGIVVTFPIVLVLVLLWRKGYFNSSKSYSSPYDDDDEMEKL
ncbi:leucine-rich repeat neuronal protein 2-like [Trichoplusia ni]|uniref:Leucine-rich repeat neuronal protein 2-like n=1 Tax=Trichoplusia ni TaxID=7111 RepID=A0A7E5WGJ9_TRINI|nr:leucine-rich repeat neuronal protein 2-like [Trichoplusia ni]XP_026739841.1 leucine-rich repeat neuronal protein 2-like [Trichoplusia ni]